MRRPAFCLIIVFLTSTLGFSAEPDRKGLDFFEAKIRPVLVRECYECHSAKAVAGKKLKGALLLDSRDASRKGGESGPAVVPGKPGESLLINALKHKDFKMPPKGKLSDAVVADFVQWIEIGAPDPRDGSAPVAAAGIDLEAGRKHWAFQPLASQEPPAVQDASWGRTSVDRFILAKQEAAGVKPNQVAEPRTLIRRATYDLIGLPPSPAEVEAFVAEVEQDLDAAWAKLIDRLLDSQHYGERWGRHWLDGARFAESHGYAFDGDRPFAYRYRDFVIQALNDDMPYDQFVRLQVAGDLLASKLDKTTSENAATALQWFAATGYVVAGPYTTQQTQKERERSRYEQLDDMIHTLGTSLLGLTVGCSRCHDHKYDPLPQFDYYRLASCFADVGFADEGVNLNPEDFAAKKSAYDKEHAPLAAALGKYEAEAFPKQFEAWLAARGAKGEAAAKPTFTANAWHHIGPFPSGADQRKAHDTIFPPQSEIDLAASYEDGKLKWTEQAEWADGQVHMDKLSGNNCANYLYRTIEASESQVLALSLGSDDSIIVWVNGRKVLDKFIGRTPAAADQEKANIQLAPGTNHVLMKICNGADKTGFYFNATAADEAADIKGILAADAKGWNADQRKKAVDWYKGYDQEWLALNQPVARHSAHEPKPTLEMVHAAKTRGTTYQFGENTYKVFQLSRGNADNKAEEAKPGFLRVAMKADDTQAKWLTLPKAEGDGTKPPRLALADWLADNNEGAGNLLARVLVNRLWYHHFGRGIVATPSDFGTRGEKPSHPELLDSLAGELIRGGWKLKPIHRLIMNSSVYMQAGDVSDAGREQDPENLLLWRRPARRLEAEIIRDALLTVSGRLDRTPFGKGTLDANSGRRSVYLTVKRGNLIPLLQLFDAPDAMQSIGSREESTVAPQALALINSPIVRGFATKFAERVQPNTETSIDDAIRLSYQIALTRSPADEEFQRMKAFVDGQIASRGKDANADQLALRDFCHLLLCANEFIYVD